MNTGILYSEDVCPACQWEAARKMRANKRTYNALLRSNPGALVKAGKIAEQPKPPHSYATNCHVYRPRHLCPVCNTPVPFPPNDGEQATCPGCKIGLERHDRWFWNDDPKGVPYVKQPDWTIA